MKRFISITFLLAMLAWLAAPSATAAPAPAAEAGAEGFTVIHDSLRIAGHMRHFKLKLPEGIKEDAPLVLFCHGYGNPGKTRTFMDAAARLHKFALCIPAGLKDSKGKPGWNVGYPSQAGWKLDDVNTMVSIAKYVQRKYSLSHTNTFLTGMSNGGDLCYLIARTRQSTFRALAPVGGLTMGWVYDQKEAPRPIPIFEIHGTADKTSYWTGDPDGKYGWGRYMAVPISIDYFVARNHCNRYTVERMESLRGADGFPTIKHKYSSDRTGCDVWLYEVVGGGHTWQDKELNTGEEVWTFFSKYIK